MAADPTLVTRSPRTSAGGAAQLSPPGKRPFQKLAEIDFSHASSDFGFVDAAALAPKHEKYKLWKAEFRNNLVSTG
jgi:hypothetical protein